MARLLYRNFWILAILLFAFLIRLPGFTYGLPLHLFGDEEVNVYSALQMIQLHTALPVLHPAQFDILYEPPLLSYIYAVAFTPVLAVMYVSAGMPPMAQFANTLTLDPSVFWIVGRLINIFISLLGIYLVYRIALYLFKEKTPALWAAFFFATSFIDSTLAATTRHWELSTTLSLLSLFLILRYTNHPARPSWLLWAGGAVLGLSFGAGYLVYYLPFIGLLILYDTWPSIFPALRFSVAFALIALAMIAVAPHPFFLQVLNHVETHEHTALQFIVFYARALSEYETPLLLFALVGLAALWRKQRELVYFFAVMLAITLGITYVFLWNLERYLHPLLPVLALMAGYGLYSLLQFLSKKKVVQYVLVGALAVYVCAVFGRYAFVAIQGDTRVQASNWVHSAIPAGATLLVDSDRVRFTPTQASLRVAENTVPEVLRSPDKALIKDPALAAGTAYNSYNLYLINGSEQQKLLTAALAHATSSAYLFTDSWSKTYLLADLSPKAAVVKTISPGEMPLPTGLFIGGEEHRGNNAHVLQLLWGNNYFGPEVDIYKINN